MNKDDKNRTCTELSDAELDTVSGGDCSVGDEEDDSMWFHQRLFGNGGCPRGVTREAFPCPGKCRSSAGRTCYYYENLRGIWENADGTPAGEVCHFCTYEK